MLKENSCTLQKSKRNIFDENFFGDGFIEYRYWIEVVCKEENDRKRSY